MNKIEAAIITAYTGITCFPNKDFNVFHKYVEDKFGHSVWTHEMAEQSFWDKLKELSTEDFMNLCNSITD